MDYVNQKPLNPLTIELYLPQGSERIEIEDEDCDPIAVSYQRNGSKLLVEVGATRGNVEMILIGEHIRSASSDDKALVVSQIASGSRIVLDGQSGLRILLELEG